MRWWFSSFVRSCCPFVSYNPELTLISIHPWKAACLPLVQSPRSWYAAHLPQSSLCMSFDDCAAEVIQHNGNHKINRWWILLSRHLHHLAFEPLMLNTSIFTPSALRKGGFFAWAKLQITNFNHRKQFHCISIKTFITYQGYFDFCRYCIVVPDYNMLQTDRLVRCKFVPQVLENKSTYVYTFILRSELTELIFILYESALKFFFW